MFCKNPQIYDRVTIREASTSFNVLPTYDHTMHRELPADFHDYEELPAYEEVPAVETSTPILPKRGLPTKDFPSTENNESMDYINIDTGTGIVDYYNVSTGEKDNSYINIEADDIGYTNVALDVSECDYMDLE